jgi:hypothetical protein
MSIDGRLLPELDPPLCQTLIRQPQSHWSADRKDVKQLITSHSRVRDHRSLDELAGIVAIDRACMFNNDAESGAGMITVYGWIRQFAE